jgi:hypothetical protein
MVSGRGCGVMLKIRHKERQAMSDDINQAITSAIDKVNERLAELASEIEAAHLWKEGTVYLDLTAQERDLIVHALRLAWRSKGDRQ